jgi:nicotinate-nucleotide adenylyltransferase
LKRIGILGGTFNPVHAAHLIIAEAAREQVHLDKVLFMPSANPPHKSGDIIEAQIRLDLVKLAIRDNKYFEASDIEIKSSLYSKSYTVDTLVRINELYRDIKIFLLIGMDNLIELHTWKEPQRLFELAEVVVLNRPGYSVHDGNDYGKRVKSITVPNIEISSTDIRKRIKDSKSIKYLVPSEVEDYIVKKRLYG